MRAYMKPRRRENFVNKIYEGFRHPENNGNGDSRVRFRTTQASLLNSGDMDFLIPCPRNSKYRRPPPGKWCLTPCGNRLCEPACWDQDFRAGIEPTEKTGREQKSPPHPELNRGQLHILSLIAVIIGHKVVNPANIIAAMEEADVRAHRHSDLP